MIDIQITKKEEREKEKKKNPSLCFSFLLFFYKSFAAPAVNLSASSSNAFHSSSAL